MNNLCSIDIYVEISTNISVFIDILNLIYNGEFGDNHGLHFKVFYYENLMMVIYIYIYIYSGFYGENSMRECGWISMCVSMENEVEFSMGKKWISITA